MPTLLDRLFPTWEVELTEYTTIIGTCSQVMRTVQTVTPAEMPLARILSWVRTLGMPRGERGRANVPLAEEVLRFGWVELGEVPDEEYVVGLVGRLWRHDFGVEPIDSPEAFVRFDEPGYLKVAVAYRCEPVVEGTRLTCETRVHATDPLALRKFRWYWRVIGVGARMTVRSGLAAIRYRVEPHAA